MKKIIKFKDITRIFKVGNNEIRALDEASLCIKEGDFVAIMGRSGSGKSTMLNIMGLLDKPTSGEYLLYDNNVKNYSDKQQAEMRNRLFGFVVQDFALVEHYTVKQNIGIPFTYSKKKYSSKEKELLIKNAMEKVGMSDKADVQACLLSGGQRQRVSIARAIICEPDIILADEPTGALDSKTSQEIMELFLELNKNGKTVIVITHDDKVAQYCNYTIEISDGKII